eukprot:gene51533-63019_t
MHACGHDIHMTSFIGTARALSQLRAQWSGTVVMIGQPAEERVIGARLMLRAGLYTKFPKPDKALALHCSSDMAHGTVGIVEGYALANVDSVEILVKGVGGHGSMPHLCIDPLVAAADIIMALQTVVARNIDAQRAAVVTVGALQAGEAANVVPQTALLRLSLRALDPQVRELQLQRVTAIIRGHAASHGCRVAIEHRPAYPVTVNHAAETAFARDVATGLLGEGAVQEAQTLMGSEDFGWMLQRCPGSYLMIGNGEGPMVHNPGYDFNDDILGRGAAYWAALAEAWLQAA